MKKLFITFFSIALMFIGCGEKKGKTTDANSEITGDKTGNEQIKDSNKSSDAICLLDKLSVRATPTDKGKWVTSMSLGEKAMYSGEQFTDSVSKKDYYKVELIDGKQGWVRTPFLAINGKVGVMIESTNVYKRPDLLTKTNNKYSPMDIIAIMSTQDDWVQVKGKRAEGKYIEEVWVKSSNISENQVDIATAKFASLANAKATMTERIKALEEVINNKDFSSSTFINVLQKKVEDYKSRNNAVDVEDSVEKTENEEQ